MYTPHISHIKYSPSGVAQCAIFAIVVLSLGWMMLWMPFSLDDIWFYVDSSVLNPDGSRTLTWSRWWQCWVSHVNGDCCRLANAMAMLSMWVPRWVPCILSTIMLAIALIFTARIAGIDRRHTPAFVIFLAMCTVLLPWYDEMFIVFFQFNYTWAWALSAWVIWLFISRDEINIIAAVALGCVIGFWHEGFGMPLFCAFTFVFIFYKRYRTPWRAALIIGIFVMLLIMWLLPGLHNRAQSLVDGNMLYYALTTLKYHLLLILIVPTVITCFFIARLRPLLSDVRFAITTVIIIIGYALNVYTHFTPRTAYLSTVCEIVMAVWLWTAMFRNITHSRNRAGRIIAGVVSAMLIAHLAVADYYAVKINRETATIIDEYSKDPHSVILADVTLEYDASPLALKKPYFELFVYEWGKNNFSKYYSTDKSPVKVVPIELKDFTAAKGYRIESNEYDIYRYDSHYVAVADEMPRRFAADIDFGYRKRTNVIVESTAFGKAPDGRRYWFLYPTRCAIPMFLGDIKDIHITWHDTVKVP